MLFLLNYSHSSITWNLAFHSVQSFSKLYTYLPSTKPLPTQVYQEILQLTLSTKKRKTGMQIIDFLNFCLLYLKIYILD